MRLAFLHPHLTYPGGAARVILELAARLTSQGHEVRVFHQRAAEDVLAEFPTVQQVEVGGPLPSQLSHYPMAPEITRRVIQRVRGWQPDIVVPNVAPSNYWGAFLKLTTPEMPVVWFCHDTALMTLETEVLESLGPVTALLKGLLGAPGFQKVDRYLNTRMDGMLVNSEFTKSLAEACYGGNPPVVHPGTDIHRFNPTDGTGDYLLIVSQLSRTKNIELALDAISQLAGTLRSRGLILRIVGDGPDRAILERSVRAAELGDLVEFMGRQPDERLPELFSRAMCTVFPSVGEPFGIVPLESMASGVPVVAVNDGGPKETVVDGETGFLVDPTPNALAQAIERILDDPTRARKMGLAGRARVEEQFTWEHTTQQFEQAIESFLP